MKNRPIIDTYSTMYPVNIVVCNKYVTLKDIRKRYTYYDGTEISDISNTYDAITIKCKNKKDNINCILIYHISDFGNNKEYINNRLKTIVHECSHVVMFTYELIGEDICLEQQEPFAYYMEYIFDCVLKTLNKK